MRTVEQNRENVRQWRLKNPEKVRAQKKRYIEKHRENIKEWRRKWVAKNRNDIESNFYWSRKLYVLKNKAKKRNLDFGLLGDEVKILRNGNCVYCGIKNPVMTIDRKDNTIGYLIENCVTACHQCNKIKGSELSFSEMMILGESIKKIRETKPNFWTFYPHPWKTIDNFVKGARNQ